VLMLTGMVIAWRKERREGEREDIIE
jgi:hypothetical protein